MLKVDNLNFSVGEKKILQEITFECGEDLLIIGKNGSGKSTLAKSIAQLNVTDTVSINNQNLQEISKAKRAQLINYIPPKLEVFDEYISAREFLELSIIDLLENSLYKDVDKISKLIEMEKFMDSHCSSLSSGEGQLLLIASGVVQNSLITILDEPTTNLDPMKVKLVFNLLKQEDLFQQKIVITHDLNFAKQLGFKILKLENGKIDFFGSSEEFFQKENIEKTFQGAVKIIDGFVVESL